MQGQCDLCCDLTYLVLPDIAVSQACCLTLPLCVGGPVAKAAHIDIAALVAFATTLLLTHIVHLSTIQEQTCYCVFSKPNKHESKLSRFFFSSLLVELVELDL